MPRLCRSGGFTLLEIVLVVLILGVLSLAVAPVIGRVVGQTGIKTEAMQLAEDIRYTQHSALSEGQMFRLELNKNSGAYLVYAYDPDADPSDPRDVRKDMAMGDSVTGISSSFPADGDNPNISYITYLATGSPSAEGVPGPWTITLTNDSGGSVSVIVALGTGRVRVQ